MATDDDPTALADAGYLPSAVDPDRGVVQMTRLATGTFREVWYADTIAAAETAGVVTVPAGALVEQFADRPRDRPLGIVAHTSRCGSTLLANLLTLRPTTIVLKEPDFVTVPARMVALAAGPAERRWCRALLRAVLSLTCRAAGAVGRDPVVKITSWTTPVLVDCLRGEPDVTWLLQWREPETVVASNVADPPSWGRDTEDGRAARQLADVDDTVTAVPDLYAVTWRRSVDAFLDAGRDLRWRSLGYRELARRKEDALLATESWLGLSSGDELPAGFDEMGAAYSKGSGTETFAPAGSHHREPLPPREAARVGALTRPALDALLAADPAVRLL